MAFGVFRIDSDGTVWRLLKRWSNQSGSGYKPITPKKVGYVGGNQHVAFHISDGRGKWAGYVHRIVYIHFHGDIPEGYEINHIDGNPQNNHPTNLEAVSHQQNVLHSRVSLGKCVGSTAPYAKLTEQAVVDIRSTYTGEFGQIKALMAKYRVSKATIYDVLKRKSWRHVS